MDKTRLIIFGVGRILLKDGINPLVDILRLLGRGKDAGELQAEYDRRKERGPWGLAEYTMLYRGEEKEKLKTIATEFLSAELRPDVHTTINTLKNRGYVVGSLSAHPDFVMEALKEMLGLDFAEGTRFEYKDGVVTGALAREFNRYSKGEEILTLAKLFDVNIENISIVANSITQIPMIEKAGRYIAFNQKKALEYNPDHEIPGGDFTKLLEIFPSF